MSKKEVYKCRFCGKEYEAFKVKIKPSDMIVISIACCKECAKKQAEQGFIEIIEEAEKL